MHLENTLDLLCSEYSYIFCKSWKRVLSISVHLCKVNNMIKKLYLYLNLYSEVDKKNLSCVAHYSLWPAWFQVSPTQEYCKTLNIRENLISRIGPYKQFAST